MDKKRLTMHKMRSWTGQTSRGGWQNNRVRLLLYSLTTVRTAEGEIMDKNKSEAIIIQTRTRKNSR
jgi:hypothetical protein